MSKITISKTSDDGLKVETITEKDVSPELLKALGVFERMTDRANQERPEVDAEKAHAEADAEAWLYTGVVRSMHQIPVIRSCGAGKFARARAKRFNILLNELKREMEDRLVAAEKNLIATVKEG